MKIGSNDIGMARNSSVTGRSKLKRESIPFEKKKRKEKKVKMEEGAKRMIGVEGMSSTLGSQIN